MPTTQDDLKILRAALMRLLLRSYPAQLSDHDLLAQADRLIRKHGRYWAVSFTAVKAYELLEG